MSDSQVSEDPQTRPLLPDHSHGLTRPRLVLLFISLYCGVMLAAIDTTVVTTLMGHIASDINALSNISWAASSYTIAYSAFQPLYGKFSDIWGRKRVSISCLAIFALGCQMCGSAKGLNLLVLGRFVSGIGAGGVLSMSTITMSDYVPLRARGIFQGIGNVAFGTGASLGGIIGGLLTSYGGWRLAFTAQVPLALVCALLQWMYLEGNKVATAAQAWERLEKIDWVGSGSLVSSLLLFMFAVTSGGSQFAWLSWQITLVLAASLLLFALFIYWEKCIARNPVMPLNIVLQRTVISACFTNFFGSGTTYAYLYYSPLFLQAKYHYSYMEISHRTVANFVAVAIGSLGSGYIMRQTGRYYALGVTCTVFMLGSSLTMILGPSFGANVAASPVYQSFSYFLNGFGYAGMLTVTLLAIISASEPKYQATTTSAQYTFRGAGSSLGIALAGSIFQNSLQSSLVTNVGTDTHMKRKIIRKVSQSLEAIWEIPKKYQPAVVKAYNHAGMFVEVFCMVWALFAVISTMFMQEHDLERKPSTDAEESDDSTNEPRSTTPPGPLVRSA